MVHASQHCFFFFCASTGIRGEIMMFVFNDGPKTNFVELAFDLNLIAKIYFQKLAPYNSLAIALFTDLNFKMLAYWSDLEFT